MDHIVIPLDADHVAAAELIVGEACGAASVACERNVCSHVTLASFEGLASADAQSAVEAVAARTAPFIVHAHGYGLFVGDKPTDLNLHVPVIRAPVLESLRADLHGALVRVGARLAPWVGPGEWSPHITLVEAPLAAEDLGRVVAQLLRRHHPSWRIPVKAVALMASRASDRWSISVPLAADPPLQ